MKLVLSLLLLCALSEAGGYLSITGKILRVENGQVIIKTESGEKSISMKSLTTQDIDVVKKEGGSKKIVTLKVPTQALIK